MNEKKFKTLGEMMEGKRPIKLNYLKRTKKKPGKIIINGEDFTPKRIEELEYDK